jgi:Holliday junction DNA helicase RuvA subunit
MIGWLQGDRIETWEQGNRRGWLIACAGVGYEVQLTERHLGDPEQQHQVTLWIHQVQKEDGSSLFGFPERRERDLFRQLISVNGVGPQMGLALLECWGPDDLVNAILDGDVRRLSQAQGVGKRTAERLAVKRLSRWWIDRTCRLCRSLPIPCRICSSPWPASAMGIWRFAAPSEPLPPPRTAQAPMTVRPGYGKACAG